MAAPVDVLAVMDALNGNTSSLRLDADVKRARAAVAELIEAVQLRVEWINGTWYVLHADGAAWTNVGHATEAAARLERSAAFDAALARCKGGVA